MHTIEQRLDRIDQWLQILDRHAHAILEAVSSGVTPEELTALKKNLARDRAKLQAAIAAVPPTTKET